MFRTTRRHKLVTISDFKDLSTTEGDRWVSKKPGTRGKCIGGGGGGEQR